MIKTKMYKLVSQDYTTHNDTKWSIGKTIIATGNGNEMCTNQVLHCYSNPHLAVIFNPKHANIKNPRLIEIKCSKIINSDGLKFACKSQTMIQEIPIPIITTTQKVAFAIKCALLEYKSTKFIAWANNWLDGTDRSYADAAANAADAAANAYAADAAYAAAYAANAAYAAAYAAADANAANAAYAAAAAAAYAADAADAAAAAANAASMNNQFITIINEVMQSF